MLRAPDYGSSNAGVLDRGHLHISPAHVDSIKGLPG